MKTINFYDVNNDDYRLHIDVGYSNGTEEQPGGCTVNLNLTIPYEKLKTVILPEDCYHCPVGFQSHNICGRNVPLLPEDGDERPDTCKLKKVDLLELLKEHLKAI